MLRRPFLQSILPAASAAFTGLLPAIAAGQEAGVTQHQLEVIYAKWRGAFRTKNLEEWLMHTSKWQQLSVRNEVISSGSIWPRAVFDLPMAPPDVTSLKGLQTKVLGAQARVVYFGKADFGIVDANAPDNMLLLWFLKENAVWKVHKAQYVQLPDQETRDKVAKGDLSLMQEEDFAISGEYPALPKPCAEPYFVGKLNVTSLGYRTTVLVNDYPSNPVQDTLGGRLIIGGVTRGFNKLRISATPIGKAAAERKLEVSVVIQTNPPREVFKWSPPEKFDATPVDTGFMGPVRR